MKEFKTYHPIVNFTYFVFVIAFSCFFMNPVCLLISLFSAFFYNMVLKGLRIFLKSLKFIIPTMIFMAFINPLFNHEGQTIVAYFPNGNPLTMESIVYGLCSSVMILSVICHFSSYNEVMTSDKFIYLFGRVIPSLSLVISMVLRFVPRFLKRLKIVINTQKCMGKDISKGSILKRCKNAFKIISIMTTWSLESSIDTSQSMKARGYAVKKRTAFSIYSFDKRDIKAFIVILILSLYVIFCALLGSMDISFYPYIKLPEITPFGLSGFTAYFLLCIYPVIIEFMEVRRWNLSKSKI